MGIRAPRATQPSQTNHQANEPDRATKGRALCLSAPDNGVAFAWRTTAGWQVRAEDDTLGDRVRAALRRPAVAPRTHTEPDGDRVLDGWEEIDPADVRYPTLFMLQLSRLGLDDLSVELVPRGEIDALVASRSSA